METDLASEAWRFFKKLQWTVSKKKIVSVNFNCALFSLVDFLTLDNGTDRLSQNIGKELPLHNM